MDTVHPAPHEEAPARTHTTARARHETLEHFHHAPTQRAVRGTAWAGYQAVVEYVDHYAPVHAAGQDAATARAVRLLTTDDPTRTKQAAWAHLSPTPR